MKQLKFTIDHLLLDWVYDTTDPLFDACCDCLAIKIYMNNALTRAINDKIRKHAKTRLRNL